MGSPSPEEKVCGHWEAAIAAKNVQLEALVRLSLVRRAVCSLVSPLFCPVFFVLLLVGTERSSHCHRGLHTPKNFLRRSVPVFDVWSDCWKFGNKNADKRVAICVSSILVPIVDFWLFDYCLTPKTPDCKFSNLKSQYKSFSFLVCTT